MYVTRRLQFAIVVLGMILGDMEGCFGNASNSCGGEHSEEMIGEIDHLVEDLKLMKLRLQGVCDVVSDHKCFALRLTGDSLSKDQAKKDCVDMDGKLADINTKGQFNALLAYGPKYDFEGNVWTAMRYVNKQLVLSDGEHASYDGWHPGWPNGDVSRTEIALAIRKSKEAPNKGMINLKPNERMQGYICEINIK